MRKKKIFFGLVIFLVALINVVYQNNLDQRILYSKTKNPDVNLDCYPKKFSGAILITSDNEIIPFVGHAGMIINSHQIIESSCLEGVHYGPNDWDISKKTCYCSIPKSISKQKSFLAANWSQNQINKKYNYNFFDWKNTDANKFYCSQIIWTAYYKTSQTDLAPNHPLILFPIDLVSNQSTKIIYLKDAYHEKK